MSKQTMIWTEKFRCSWKRKSRGMTILWIHPVVIDNKQCLHQLWDNAQSSPLKRTLHLDKRQLIITSWRDEYIIHVKSIHGMLEYILMMSFWSYNKKTLISQRKIHVASFFTIFTLLHNNNVSRRKQRYCYEESYYL